MGKKAGQNGTVGARDFFFLPDQFGWNRRCLSGLGRLPTEERLYLDPIENLYGHEDLAQTYEQLKSEGK